LRHGPVIAYGGGLVRLTLPRPDHRRGDKVLTFKPLDFLAAGCERKGLVAGSDHQRPVHLDHEPMSACRNGLCEQASELGLGPRVKVDLGLLEQKALRLRGDECINHHRQYLAHAVPNVHQVEGEPADADVHLERVARRPALAPDVQLAKEAGLGAERRQICLQFVPPLAFRRQASQQHRDVPAFGFGILTKWVVGSMGC